MRFLEDAGPGAGEVLAQERRRRDAEVDEQLVQPRSAQCRSVEGATPKSAVVKRDGTVIVNRTLLRSYGQLVSVRVGITYTSGAGGPVTIRYDDVGIRVE